MSIFTKSTVIASYPAYDIIKREKARQGYVNLVAGETLVKSDHLGSYKINSAVSYALENNQDPIESYNQCLSNGDDTHWINAQASSLSDCKEAKKVHIEIDFETTYMFEGKWFNIKPSANNNLRLVPATFIL
jgi:hypothetical protein